MQAESRYGQFDPGDPDYPDLAKVYDYWQHKLNGRFAPSWVDINLLDLPTKTIPRVCIINVNTKRADFTYRFWGTALTGMHDYDLTGKSVLNLKPAYYARMIYQQYKSVYDAKASFGFLTEIPLESGLLAYYAVVRMPLSSNGQDIDMIMSAEDHGSGREQLRDAFHKVIQNHM